ncbi:MAG TPA: hypothetical protein DDY77_04665 [Clostridiales bacterium]|nr:hypothetical protein [Clostridiales bacterium]
MGKSVYSVVLDDEVVRLVDKAAAKTGESRSLFINRVLAKEVGFSTSKQKLDKVVDALDTAISAHETIRMVRRQKSVVDFLGSLNYKYSPRVTYSVELDPEKRAARLKIALRTTSPELSNICAVFFDKFVSLEKGSESKNFFFVEDGKIIRDFTIPSKAGGEEIAKLITDYVDCFDALLNAYIGNYPFGNADEKLVEDYLRLAPKMVL